MSTNNIKASNSTDTTTTLDDNISRGIEKVTIDDNVDVSRYDDMSGTRLEEMNNKNCTSCDKKLEHTKTHEIISHNSASDKGDTTDVVSRDIPNSAEVSICANCGKAGAKNICNKCKMVKYCNAACKKKHRSKHKKACERRVEELRDIELFKEPPLLHGDCPICFLRMPTLTMGFRYKQCCGKIICCGCIHAVEKADGGIGLCPFCRVPSPSSDKIIIEQLLKRVNAGDALAIHTLGGMYNLGMYGFNQNYTKALELWHKAADIGCAKSYHDAGVAYYNGKGVEKDEMKGEYYMELAAIRGNTEARHNLGSIEHNVGDMKRAIKHLLIAVGHGQNKALKNIQMFYSQGKVTKDEYAKALRAYQEYVKEIRSPQRDEAAAYGELYKYY